MLTIDATKPPRLELAHRTLWLWDAATPPRNYFQFGGLLRPRISKAVRPVDAVDCPAYTHSFPASPHYHVTGCMRTRRRGQSRGHCVRERRRKERERVVVVEGSKDKFAEASRRLTLSVVLMRGLAVPCPLPSIQINICKQCVHTRIYIQMLYS